MIRLFRRTWKYTAALLGHAFERAADPEIQIEQAIEEGKRQHALLVQQAAAVIGNQHEIEMRLARTMSRVEDLRGSAREALRLGDEARSDDDETAATSYDEAAHSFALTLVTAETEMRDLKVLHDHAIDGASTAKDAVEQSAHLLQNRLAERTRLLSQLQQTKLQERMNSAIASVSALTPDGDVPSLETIRDKIERRYALALGTAELGASSVEVHTMTVRKASLDAEAAQQLAALRLTLASEASDEPSRIDAGPRTHGERDR